MKKAAPVHRDAESLPDDAAAGQAETSAADQAAHPDQPGSPVSSAQLLQGRQMVEISHNGAVYRLQTTRQGKLILTK